MEKRSLIKEEIYGGGGRLIRRCRRQVFMKTPIHLKSHGDGIFHLHPLHGAFAVIASFVLAVLIVLMLVPSAR